VWVKKREKLRGGIEWERDVIGGRRLGLEGGVGVEM
jgi:hypothetical protein